MSSPRKLVHKSVARIHALKYLYQCESEKIHYFFSSHFEVYAEHFKLGPAVKTQCLQLCRLTLDHLAEIDAKIQGSSSNWSLSRMPLVDLCVLRLALCELLKLQTPTKVVLNEAIELAKNYGTEASGRFVNGVLADLALKSRST
ncbi:MAG: transcription antitermination factor NusB, partial [Oligoflexales bacterium]|nr:transcription antitermination factor NusB [Oligoflexales bacterium]